MLKCWYHLNPVQRVAHVLGARIQLMFEKSKGGASKDKAGMWLSANDWEGGYDCKYRVHPDDAVLEQAAIHALGETQHTFEWCPDGDGEKVRFTVPKHALGSGIPIIVPYGFGYAVQMDLDGHIEELVHVRLRAWTAPENEDDKKMSAILAGEHFRASKL